MRAYFFGNMYLSSIQQGIQAGHVIGEMSVKYGANPDSMFSEWAKDHKTMILLNSGMSSNLSDIVKHLSKSDNPFNWAPFFESREALDGALTSVGIILPEEIYSVKSSGDPVRDRLHWSMDFDPWHVELLEIITSKRTAI